MGDVFDIDLVMRQCSSAIESLVLFYLHTVIKGRELVLQLKETCLADRRAVWRGCVVSWQYSWQDVYQAEQDRM